MIIEAFVYKYAQDENEKRKIKEGFDDSSSESNKQWSTGGIIVLIIYILLGLYAAKLSWNSNSRIHWDTGFKIFFAIFAFLSPLSYLPSHLIYKVDLLRALPENVPKK